MVNIQIGTDALPLIAPPRWHVASGPVNAKLDWEFPRASVDDTF